MTHSTLSLLTTVGTLRLLCLLKTETDDSNITNKYIYILKRLLLTCPNEGPLGIMVTL